MASPYGLSALQMLCAFLVVARLISVDAQPTDSECSLGDATPTNGDALLQRHKKGVSETSRVYLAQLAIADKFGLHDQSHSSTTDDDFLAKAEKKLEAKFCTGDESKPEGSDTSFLADEFRLDDAVSISASLDESGFQKVAAENDDKEMKTFIRRVAESCNMRVIDEGGLNGAAEWFGEDKGSYDQIKKALFKALFAASRDNWVSVKNATDITGKTAPIDSIGYVQVRARRSSKDMITFIRRMTDSMGIKITNEGGFDGLMRYYSEPDDSESFARLIPEIRRAAIDHTWAEFA